MIRAILRNVQSALLLSAAILVLSSFQHLHTYDKEARANHKTSQKTHDSTVAHHNHHHHHFLSPPPPPSSRQHDNDHDQEFNQEQVGIFDDDHHYHGSATTMWEIVKFRLVMPLLSFTSKTFQNKIADGGGSRIIRLRKKKRHYYDNDEHHEKNNTKVAFVISPLDHRTSSLFSNNVRYLEECARILRASVQLHSPDIYDHSSWYAWIDARIPGSNETTFDMLKHAGYRVISSSSSSFVEGQEALLDHDWVVHLPMDTIVLNSLDHVLSDSVVENEGGFETESFVLAFQPMNSIIVKYFMSFLEDGDGDYNKDTKKKKKNKHNNGQRKENTNNDKSNASIMNHQFFHMVPSRLNEVVSLSSCGTKMPWECPYFDHDEKESSLLLSCDEIYRAWFRVRWSLDHEYDQSDIQKTRAVAQQEEENDDRYYGYCQEEGTVGYRFYTSST